MVTYRPFKRNEEVGKLKEELRIKDEEMENTKKLYDERIKSLEEKVEILNSENKRLKGKENVSLSYDEAKKKIKELMDEARDKVIMGHPGTGRTLYYTYCPICHGYLDEHGCAPSTQIESDRIVYGMQCNKKGNFYKQGEIPIPKHLREFL